MYIKVNAKSQKTHPWKDRHGNVTIYNPERNLTRYQFMEFLVKLAIERHSRKIYKNFDHKKVKPGFYTEALEKFFNDTASYFEGFNN